MRRDSGPFHPDYSPPVNFWLHQWPPWSEIPGTKHEHLDMAWFVSAQFALGRCHPSTMTSGFESENYFFKGKFMQSPLHMMNQRGSLLVEGSFLDRWETTHPDSMSPPTVVALGTTKYRQENSAQGRPPNATLDGHSLLFFRVGKAALSQVARRQGRKIRLSRFSWPRWSTTWDKICLWELHSFAHLRELSTGHRLSGRYCVQIRFHSWRSSVIDLISLLQPLKWYFAYWLHTATCKLGDLQVQAGHVRLVMPWASSAALPFSTAEMKGLNHWLALLLWGSKI